MAFIKQAFAIAWKDLLAEGRRKEGVNALAFFAVLILFIFQFALGPDRERLEAAASGLLWLGFALTGILGFSRAFQAEMENECFEGLLLYPGDRGALYLGKLGGNLLFILAVELFLLPLFAVFFNFDLLRSLPSLLLIVFLGTLGFSCVGTLFSAMTAHMRARELLFPLLVLPITIPALLASVKSTEVVLAGGPFGEALPWVKLLLGFDGIFFVVGLFAFEFVVEE